MIIENIKYQPRFQAFINYKELKIGDTYKGYEFINFIQTNLRNFLKDKGVNSLINDQLHDQFTNYLFSL